MNFEPSGKVKMSLALPITKDVLVRVKLIMLLLTAFCLRPSAKVFGQRITLEERNATLVQVLRKIEKQSGYTFFYNKRDVSVARPINVSIKDKDLEAALESVFEDTPYGFDIQEKIIVLNRRPVEQRPTKLPVPVTEVEIQQQVSGRVTDSLGNPLQGVSVLVQGTTRGTATNLTGHYVIDAELGNVLVFRTVGYVVREITVARQTVLDVVLQEEKSDLDEVVVVAFGTQKKESVIASITTVNPSELRVPSSNLTTSFAGRIAGMISYQRTGEPGQDNAQFFIRGVTSFGTGKVDPLILIDNVEMTTEDLSRLNVDD